MQGVKIKVVRVTGKCNAELEVGDAFCLQGLEIFPLRRAKACQVAFASLIQNAGRLRLRGSPLYIACPDPGTGAGGNVIFELTLEGEDELDKN